MADPRVLETKLPGVLLVEPTPVHDERGFFVRTMDADVLATAGIGARSFVQENQSRSRRGTLRGLHTRRELTESKLVRCARGAVFEVVVDLRPWSPRLGEWASFSLDDQAHRQLYVPAGCAHGFLVLSDLADVCYRHDARYAPELEAALRWDDPDLGIPWPESMPVLSARDRDAPTLAEVLPLLPEWFGTSAPERD